MRSPIGVAALAWPPVAGWMKMIGVSIRALSLIYALYRIARGKTAALSDELNGFRMTARTWVLVAWQASSQSLRRDAPCGCDDPSATNALLTTLIPYASVTD
jgi:hypothetical protein